MDGYYKLFAWIMTLGVIALFIAGVIYRVEIGENVETGIATYGLIGLFVLVFLFDFLPQIMSTYIPVTSAMLFGMNPIAVCIVSIVASAIGSVLAFEIGSNASKGFLSHVINIKDHKKVEAGVNKWGKWVLLIAAFTPLPYIPLLFGALKLTRRNFWIYGVAAKTLDFIVTVTALALIF